MQLKFPGGFVLRRAPALFGAVLLVFSLWSSAARAQFDFFRFAGYPGQHGSVNGLAHDARFRNPTGIARDTAGNFYVADTGNQVIRKIAPDLTVTYLAGAVGQIGSVDGSGTAARFAYPWGIAVDASGNVFVADSGNHTIRKITPSGFVTTLAGLAGQAGSADGSGSAARFNNPSSIALDASGNLWVTDYLNCTLRKVTSAGVVTTVAGAPGQYGSADGVGSAARFSFPDGLALDEMGNIYVVDTNNHAIRKVTPAGEVTTFAGTLQQSGYRDSVDGPPLFSDPGGIIQEPNGSFLVTDRGNSVVRRVTPGGYVTTIAGRAGVASSESGLGTDARFDGLIGIVTDSSGNVWISETTNQMIRQGDNLLGNAWLTVPELFDAERMRQRYPALAAFPDDGALWEFFLHYGVYQGMTDGAFDPAAYLAQNSYLRTMFGNDLAASAVYWYAFDHRPTASFSISGERHIGQTLTITVNVDDPEKDYAYANLWIYSPSRGWLTLREDNSVVQSGSLIPANTVASTPGTHQRQFTFTPTDGVGTYLVGMSAVDALGFRRDVATQSFTVQPNRPPTGSFSYSSHRVIGQTLDITVNVGDPDGNYAYANLWIRTPNRGWLTLRADNSIVQSGSLIAANTVATSAGTHQRQFSFTPTDGPGTYLIGMSVVDSSGARTDIASQSFTVTEAANQPPTGSFSLSSERAIGQTMTITVNVGDPDGNYAYANLWIRSPTRGWLTVKADNSIVQSGALVAANTVAATAGTHTRQFTFTPTDGPGTYAIGMSVVDAAGARTDIASQSFLVTETPNEPPTASFSISSERAVGQTLTITVNVGDPDGNYSYANLWVRSPTRGWLTIRADNSVVVSGALDPANNVATTAGTHVRQFTFTPTDGPGTYRVGMSAVDSMGARTDIPTQTITVTP
jgi:hypothetical protein